MMYKLLTSTSDLLIGADPEVFLMDKHGRPTPACGLIGGTKEEPVPVPCGAVQEDNVMAEFNIDPASDVTTFVHNVCTVYNELLYRAKAHGLDILIQASATFPMFILEQHPQALEFGCTPDFNAYTETENESPNPECTLRTCAGHVHLGFEAEVSEKDYFNMCCRLVHYLDLYVGTWTVEVDEDTRRRERYGKAGAFRPKPYGLEYRVPSNFWLKSDALMTEMFSRIKHAYAMAQMGDNIEQSLSTLEQAINTHDKGLCNSLRRGV